MSKKKMGLVISLTFISIPLLIILFWFIWGWFNINSSELKIEDKVTIQIDIAADLPRQIRGLSGREFLGETEGMLFVYDRAAFRQFWMKEMLIPLDFIWIKDFEIVSMHENIPHPAENNGEIYRVNSGTEADMVLEINAGSIEKFGLEIGDKVELK